MANNNNSKGWLMVIIIVFLAIIAILLFNISLEASNFLRFLKNAIYAVLQQ
ncbi:hypothetical protein LCGC14_2762870 [marine sediment metagenome]|uniref:Uncharacterized protein n=1 Tax=marine sediment metagenome TaxID=412755 RepID=A0A0F9BQ33_9ZZZZ